MKTFIIICILPLFFLSFCKKKEDKYIQSSAVVYNVKPVHQGGRRFKLLVQYKFVHNKKTYTGFDNFKMGSISSSMIYDVGDHISIEFPEGHPEKSRGRFNH
jgi:hypothetical protein